MKTIQNIFSSLLILMFLVPATGFYYTRHSCLTSGEVQYVLDEKHSCCAKTTPISHDPVNQESSCCDMVSDIQANSDSKSSLEDSSLECCINVGNYLKSESEYISPGRLEMPHIEVTTSSALYCNDLIQNLEEIIEENAHSPPFTLSSTDILHKHSVLII